VAGVFLGAGTGQVHLENQVVTVSDLAVGPFSAAAKVDLSRREALVDARLIGFGLDTVAPHLLAWRVGPSTAPCTVRSRSTAPRADLR